MVLVAVMQRNRAMDQEKAMTTDDQKPTLASLRATARDQRPADAVGAVRAIRDREPTDEQRDAIKRLRQHKAATQDCDSPYWKHFEIDEWMLVADWSTCADLHLFENPADGPSVADELREAREIIATLLPINEWCTNYRGLSGFPNDPIKREDIDFAHAFLDRTSRFEEQR